MNKPARRTKRRATPNLPGWERSIIVTRLVSGPAFVPREIAETQLARRPA